MPEHDSYRSQAHSKVEWLAYQKRLAEIEELRAMELACERAVQEVLALRTRLLDAQLDRQGAELAWHALHLVRQTELLDSFRTQLRTIIGGAGNPLHIVRQIGEKLKQLPCEVIDWTMFDMEFQSTYPEFQLRLITRYPELTGMEIKACTLLKLELTLVDIATLLCLSQRSMKEHRLRIREKMGLTLDEDLRDVLAGI